MYRSDDTISLASRTIKAKLLSSGIYMETSVVYTFQEHMDPYIRHEYVQFAESFVDQLLVQGFVMYTVVTRTASDQEGFRVFYPKCISIDGVEEIRLKQFSSIQVIVSNELTRRRVFTYIPNDTVSLTYMNVPQSICASLYRSFIFIQTIESITIRSEHRRSTPSVLLESQHKQYDGLMLDMINQDLDVGDTERLHADSMETVDRNIMGRLHLQQHLLRAYNYIDRVKSSASNPSRRNQCEEGLDPINHIPCFGQSELNDRARNRPEFVTVPHGTKVATNTPIVPPPSRSDILQMRTEFRDSVCRSMGVPNERNFDRTVDGVRAKEDGLYTTANYYKRHITTVFDNLFQLAFRNEEIKPRIKWMFPSLYTTEKLVTMKENNLIDEATLRKYLSRMYDF